MKLIKAKTRKLKQKDDSNYPQYWKNQIARII